MSRLKVLLVGLGCVLLLVAGYLISPVLRSALQPSPRSTPTSSAERDASVQALGALATVPVRARDKVSGYDRSCSAGHACVFGPAWSDDTSALGGHNGCDTRNDVLAAQLTEVAVSHCVVQTGILDDPYTGTRIAFTKAQADLVQIDHVVPLAYAWDMGAATWDPELRKAFANDEARNLLAVAKAANAAKNDSGPGAWMPDNVAYRCQYAIRWVDVLTMYELAVSARDHDALRDVLTGCGR